MKAAILQMPVALGERGKNEDTLRRMLEGAMKDSPDVILLPELWDIGFFPRPLADYTDAGGERAKALLSSLAKEHGVAIVGGSVARGEKDGVRNTCFVFDKDGALVASYDKTHLFSPAKEEKRFVPGDHAGVFSLAGVKCAVLICYDLRFPEIFRRLALSGAEVIFLPAEWPTARLMHWRTLTRARAIENELFIAAANGSGAFANGMPLAGHSVIIDPWGGRLAEAEEGEAVIFSELDLKKMNEAKRTIDVLKDRRPDLYTGLYDKEH